MLNKNGYIAIIVKLLSNMKRLYLNKIILLLSFCMIFSIISCNNKSQVSGPELSKRSSDILQKYLDEKVIRPLYSGKVFSAFSLFKNEGDTLYIWAYMQEYYKEDNAIKQGSGWSVPMEIIIKETPQEVIIKRLFTPSDGDMYTKGIRNHFPADIQKQILDFPGTPEVKELEKYCEERADKFFK